MRGTGRRSSPTKPLNAPQQTCMPCRQLPTADKHVGPTMAAPPGCRSHSLHTGHMAPTPEKAIQMRQTEIGASGTGQQGR